MSMRHRRWARYVLTVIAFAFGLVRRVFDAPLQQPVVAKAL